MQKCTKSSAKCRELKTSRCLLMRQKWLTAVFEHSFKTDSNRLAGAPSYRDREDSAICADLYARARTREDTTRIDVAPAFKERGRGARNAVPACGELRRAEA